MAPMPIRGHQPATTRDSATSPVNVALLNANVGGFGDGIAAGSPEELRAAHKAASDRVWPQTNHDGKMTGVTTTDSLKAGEHFKCAKCGAETALLVEQTGRPGRHHAVCIQCAGVPTLGATIPSEGDAPLPKGREKLEPTYALTED